MILVTWDPKIGNTDGQNQIMTNKLLKSRQPTNKFPKIFHKINSQTLPVSPNKNSTKIFFQQTKIITDLLFYFSFAQHSKEHWKKKFFKQNHDSPTSPTFLSLISSTTSSNWFTSSFWFIFSLSRFITINFYIQHYSQSDKLEMKWMAIGMGSRFIRQENYIFFSLWIIFFHSLSNAVLCTIFFLLLVVLCCTSQNKKKNKRDSVTLVIGMNWIVIWLSVLKNLRLP